VSSSDTSPRPLAPDRFGYVRVAVADLDAATAYYERYAGLEVVERSPEVVLLRAGTWHHAINLVKDAAASPSRVEALGWVTDDQDVLDSIAARVERSGRAVGSLSPTAKSVSVDGFTVEDPHGITWEVLTGFHEFAEPPFTALAPVQVLHPFIVTDRYEEALAFATDVFGFQVSDYIADVTAFLRGESRYHHCLALLKGTASPSTT
jgi:catechol-2,3-dioxygenase